MKILDSKIQWRYPLSPINQNNIQYIVLHHIAAKEATPMQVDEWDKSFGWNGGGYNYYVRKDGSIYEMRGDNIGSQCYGYNSVSYGIGCEGDYENHDTIMPPAQYNSLLELIAYLKSKFTNARIVGHKELFNTACPGKYFPLDKIKNMEPLENPIDDIKKSIEILSEHNIIKDTSYWYENVHDSGAVDGKYMKQLILNFVACYEIKFNFNDVLTTLSNMELKEGVSLISDKSYWLEFCEQLKTVEGCWAEILIKRMAQYIQERS